MIKHIFIFVRHFSCGGMYYKDHCAVGHKLDVAYFFENTKHKMVYRLRKIPAKSVIIVPPYTKYSPFYEKNICY